MNQQLRTQNCDTVYRPTARLQTLTELWCGRGQLPDFRPVVVEEFGPGQGPGASTRFVRPQFSLGTFTAGGQTLIGATSVRQECTSSFVPTFLTVDAWAACGLSFNSPRCVGDFFRRVEDNLRRAILVPDVHFWVGTEPQVHLRALYGPSPFGDETGCLVISLLDEPRWVKHRVPLGTVVIVSDQFLDPDQVFEPLGRHAAGDWGVRTFLDPAENEMALRRGGTIHSYYELPSIGQLWVEITTDLEQQETRFRCLS